MELTVTPNIELTSDDKFIILFEFDVPANTTSGVCAVENPTCMGANDTLLLTSTALSDISNVLKFDDKIIGDIEFLKVDKTFRISLDNSNYSAWTPLNEDSIKAICGYDKIYIQFRYVACEIVSDFDLDINPISKPDNVGWFKLHSSSGFYQFDTDYPETGDIEYNIGFGTNGQLHYDDSTDRFHFKNNGFWSSPYIVQRNSSTSGVTYVPTDLGDVVLTDETIATASTGGFVPMDDYSLMTDIRFGETLETSENSTLKVPKDGDFIFINPLLQGFELQGVESLFINHIPRVLPEGYEPKIWLENICIESEQNIPVVEGNTVEPIICLDGVGDQTIFSPNMVLKVFSLDSFCLVVDGIEGTNSCIDCLDIKFRYSSTTRYWESEWLPLTEANLKCVKPSPLKFFYIEFLFTQTCDNGGKPICITDLIINGDYQNVSNDYEQLNRFGMRPDCNYGLDEEGGTDHVYDPNSGAQPPAEWSSNDLCPTEPSFNPYDFNVSNHLYEKLANDISGLFGHGVEYYKVEANNAGIDKVLHEYQTYDTTQKETVKVLVPDNAFPEDQVAFNMFDLGLFDSFEIHITRKEFHSKFGIGSRPANKDYLFFCAINKWYEIEHAQSFREYNNTSVYYKVTLTKKSDDKNIDNRAFENEFEGLIKNNTLDNLFQDAVEENEDQVVNKQIQENLTENLATDVKLEYDNSIQIETSATMGEEEIKDVKKPDPVNLSIFATNIEQDLVNGPNVISRNYYDFTSRTNDNALIYQTLDNSIQDCDNRAFMTWFKVNNYVQGQAYNMINNYNNVIKNGYKIDFIDGRFEIVWFGQMFDIDVSIGVNKWYSVLVNFNQKQGKLELFLYTRRDDGLCATDELILVSEHEMVLTPVSFNGELVMSVKGSPMNWTNMRVFKEIIPKSKANLTLNQYIIKNTELLIIADNAQKTIITPHWKF